RNEENEESERLPHKTYSGSVIFITLLALLVTLTRTEGVIVGASAMALGVFFHWKCGRKPWLWACLSYLSIFAAYTAWRWLYFGSLLTGPTLVKLSQNMLPGNIASMEFVLDCWDYLRTSPLGMYTLILFPIGLYLVCNRKSYKTKSSPAIAAQAVLAIAIIQLLCLNLVYARTNMIQNFGSRFFVQTAAQQLVIVALIGAWLYRGWLDFVLKPVAKHIPRAFLFILLIGAFGLLTIRWAGSAGALTRSYAKFIQEYNQQQSSARAIADVFNQHQKELQDQWLVTVVDSGILPYYAGMNVLGGDGLTDTNLSRFVPPTGEKAAPYSSYIYSHTPAIFVIEIYAGHLDAHHQALVCDPEFRYYNFVGGLQRKQGNTYNIYLRENLPAYDTIADQLMNLSDPQQRWHVSDQNPKATCPY
ncbi:MAG: hypothetical protein U9Q82_15185, partial [Chloroflexota bacterium]|nr:hypothetical protein [Chloroflexota bacterium]